jgi:integrase
MDTYNAVNERLKRTYFDYLEHGCGKNTRTIDENAKALALYEHYTGWRAFGLFKVEHAIAFKQHILSTPSRVTGEPLSRASAHKVLSNLVRFFCWLAGRQGFRSKIQYSDAQYFNLSVKDIRIARAKRYSPTATLEQIHLAISLMPIGSLIDRRNRALLACAILTGARDGALASFKLKHVLLEDGVVLQDARDVRTKFSKTFPTFFFPVGGAAREVFESWVHELGKLGWTDVDPLFPATSIGHAESMLYEVSGLQREHWSTAGPIRKIFRAAFENAEMAYFHPHSFRRTLVALGGRICRTPEEAKAWSQNLGHESVQTTWSSYGALSPERQKDVLGTIADRDDRADPVELSEARDLAEALLEKLRRG